MEGFTVTEKQRKALGFYINRRRRMNGLTVSYIANSIGVKVDYIRALERGQIVLINPLVIMKVGELLEVNYIFLYTLAGYVKTHDLNKMLTHSRQFKNLIDNFE